MSHGKFAIGSLITALAATVAGAGIGYAPWPVALVLVGAAVFGTFFTWKRLGE